MFLLQTSPIDPAVWRARLARADAGACVVFEGWVRDHHLGRGVARLEFEAFDALARTEGEQLIGEIEARYPDVSVCCIHRTGPLAIGDMAVWIGATSPHRAAAFAACRDAIEELKRRLPIWKKEHYLDGTADWVDCTREQNPAARREEYFSRVAAVDGIGRRGLDRLARSRVVVLGAGGLGSAALEALAASGVGELVIVDDGLVERSNLPRQPLYADGEIGLPKAAAAAARLRLRNPFVKLAPRPVRCTPTNAAPLFAGADVVLDCSDNLATRALAVDGCARVGVPLVQAAVRGFDGTITTRLPDAPWAAPRWPESAGAEEEILPVFSPAAAVVGQLQAAEAIKWLLGLEVPSSSATLLVDLRAVSITAIARPTLHVAS